LESWIVGLKFKLDSYDVVLVLAMALFIAAAASLMFT
jgi:hypothetical protein